MYIDAHQHFWKFDPIRDSWITDEMKLLRADFLPGDLRPLLDENNIDGCVLVQSDQTIEGNLFMIELANENPFIKAVVAWIDLQADDLEEQLVSFKRWPVVKGFRHILQSEENRAFMLTPSFLNGIKQLSKFNFTYDILIFSDQLQYMPEFVKRFPEQRFVLDHIAKPNIKSGDIRQWREHLQALSQFENLYCKLSGMVTEADWRNWKFRDFVPYLDAVVETFGIDRLMYGSDWPVCLLAAGYQEQFSLLNTYLSRFSKDEKDAILGKNANRFYNLEL